MYAYYHSTGNHPYDLSGEGFALPENELLQQLISHFFSVFQHLHVRLFIQNFIYAWVSPSTCLINSSAISNVFECNLQPWKPLVSFFTLPQKWASNSLLAFFHLQNGTWTNKCTPPSYSKQFAIFTVCPIIFYWIHYLQI